jgi:hypothetical protein
VGTGAMPLEVAAARGERFPRDKRKADAYRDARTTVTLGAGERKPIVIRSAFEPERLLMEPDVRVLMLERKEAEVWPRASGPSGGAVARLSPGAAP